MIKTFLENVKSKIVKYPRSIKISLNQLNVSDYHCSSQVYFNFMNDACYVQNILFKVWLLQGFILIIMMSRYFTASDKKQCKKSSIYQIQRLEKYMNVRCNKSPNISIQELTFIIVKNKSAVKHFRVFLLCLPSRIAEKHPDIELEIQVNIFYPCD